MINRVESMLLESQKIAHLGTWEWDLETNVLYWSDETYRIFGVQPETFKPTIEGFAALIHPEDREWVTRAIDDSNYRKVPYDVEHRIVLPDGRERIIHQQGKSFQNSTGQTIRALGTTFDITDRKIAENRLRLSNEILERQAAQLRRMGLELTRAEQRERQRMAAILHNHLQQLLVGTRYNVDALMTGLKTKKLQEIALVVGGALDEAIEASRSLAIDLCPPILREGGLCEALQWLSRRMLKMHGLTIRTAVETVRVNDDLGPVLFYAVSELLLNVSKHAGVSAAQVELTLLEDRRLCISVSDEGCGFDPAHIRDKDDSLGLFAIHERMEAISGSMVIDSTPGRGCCVTLIAPLGKPSLPNDEAPVRGTGLDVLPEGVPLGSHSAPQAGQKIRVLLVDDHTVVRQGLAQLLACDSGLEVVGEASNGEIAVRMAREIRPDVILMDVNMPEMNGVEATRRILAELPGIVVIGLSMYQEEHRAEEMRKAGAAAYVSKAAVAEDLVATIYSCCRLRLVPSQEHPAIGAVPPLLRSAGRRQETC